MITLTEFIYCQGCEALLTSADDEAQSCTQCEAPLPTMRRLLYKIEEAHSYDPGETDLDDKQPVTLTINLGDVRFVRGLLK